MKQRNYKYVLLFITLTVVATIGLQLYWNFKNYKENQRRLINEVQIAFDNSIEYYYVEDTKNDFIAFVNKNKSSRTDNFIDSVKTDTAFTMSVERMKKRQKKINPTASKKWSITTIKGEYKVNSTDSKSGKSQLDSTQKQIDSLKNKGSSIIIRKPTLINPEIAFKNINPAKISSVNVFRGKKSVDSISGIKDLAERIVISMIRDSINFNKLSANLKKELKRKNIAVDFAISHFKSDTLFEKFQPLKKIDLPLQTTSKSTYLPENQSLKLSFSNPMMLVLKRSITEIILSFLLSLSVIGCLLYLLRTINRQKKVDEIKNDLISNITHEFKTPITTISTAIEGIKIFNADNDPEKTKRYLSISENQLKKLEIMVEKLLETSTLETDKLILKKEKVNVFALVKDSIEKHRLICPEKEIELHSNTENLMVNLDVFHFENGISNLIDNALKYGGNRIQVFIEKTSSTVCIIIEDNGSGIEKKHREKIFEKFYRIPKGNVHDVKGFGIGLYYTKKIIEKHNGSLKLISDSNTTSFKITLPNEL